MTDNSRYPDIVEHLTDIVMMLDAPDAYNREYIAAVCRSLLRRCASQPATPTGGETAADRLRKDCGAANGCSCADLNYQWYGPHCEATMTSVMRSMLKEAATPTGGEAWCQPMDCGEHTPRKFLLYFEDADRGIAVFDNEVEARAAFEKANTAWNCYLFGALPLATAMAQSSEGEEPFYGSQCPSYPACNGGCGLGCTYEIYQSRAARLSAEIVDHMDGGRPLPLSRDDLGRMVREAWVRWAQTQPNPKPTWLVPYSELPEPDKEADRQIGEAVARWTLIADAARASLNVAQSAHSSAGNETLYEHEKRYVYDATSQTFERLSDELCPAPAATITATQTASDEVVLWSRVNDEPFEYAIQKGPHGDEFVKLINGTCLRRSTAGVAQGSLDPAVEKVILIARDVVWFDWSGNDTDAVHAIEQLRLALSAISSTDQGCGDPNCKDPNCTYGRGPNRDPLSSPDRNSP